MNTDYQPNRTTATGDRRSHWLWVATILNIVFVMSVVVPGVFGQSVDQERSQAMRTLEQVFQFIQSSFVEEIDAQTLLEGALEGMFESLDDPYSAFLDVESMRSLNDTTSGEFGGVGMYIRKQTEAEAGAQGSADLFVEVSSPIEDTPAFRAGILSGDLIVAVDGESTAPLNIDEVVSRLRGTPGTEVAVTIRRGRNINFSVSLERAIIEIPTVKYAMVEPAVAFLRIIQFTPRTVERVREAIDFFQQNNYRAMIIDLRDNPGGLLNAVVDVADLFFSGGVIVGTHSRVPGENEVFRARNFQAVPNNIAVVTLINGGSASASEILAGALRDRDRAALIGETTFGKGSVQTVRSLGDVGFRLTLSRYYTPLREFIDKVGIAPDVEARLPELDEDQEAAYSRVRSENVVQTFVDRQPEPTAAAVNAFAAELRSAGMDLPDRIVRRLVRLEVDRRSNRQAVFDLDFDTVLREAMQLVNNGRVQAIIDQRIAERAENGVSSTKTAD